MAASLFPMPDCHLPKGRQGLQNGCLSGRISSVQGQAGHYPVPGFGFAKNPFRRCPVATGCLALAEGESKSRVGNGSEIVDGKCRYHVFASQRRFCPEDTLYAARMRADPDLSGTLFSRNGGRTLPRPAHQGAGRWDSAGFGREPTEGTDRGTNRISAGCQQDLMSPASSRSAKSSCMSPAMQSGSVCG